MSGEDRPAELTDLLEAATVRLVQGGSRGTGFFVAPGLVLTCGHVVQQEAPVECWRGEVRRRGRVVERLVEDPRYPGERYPDVALLEVEDTAHPCALLGGAVELGDELYAYGYSDQAPGGDPVTLELEGRSESPARLKLKAGQVRPGMSGAPILNLRTGVVCGMASISRDRGSALGARGVPADVVLERLPDVARLQRDFHGANGEWLGLLSRDQRAALVSRGARGLGSAAGAAAAVALVTCTPFHLYLLAPGRGPFAPWKSVGPSGVVVRAIALDPQDPATLFVGLAAGRGVFASTDGGLGWLPAFDGLGDRQIFDLHRSPHDGGMIAATADGLWTSPDDGGHWTPCAGTRGRAFLMFAESPLAAGFVVAGTRRPGGTSAGAGTVAVAAQEERYAPRPGLEGGHLHLSLDGGGTWRTVPVRAGFHGAAFSRQDSRLVYLVSADDHSIWRLFDPERGPEVLETFPGRSPWDIAVAPEDDRFVVVGARDGLYLSRDGGGQWEKVEEVGDREVIRVTVAADGLVLAATADGVFESRDHGGSWLGSSGLLPYPRSLAIATTAAGDVFVGTDGGGVYRRRPRQRNWTAVNAGLPPIACFEAVPAGERLYAACSNGVHWSRDGGRSWTLSNLNGAPVVDLLAFPPATPGPCRSFGNLEIGVGGAAGLASAVAGEMDRWVFVARVYVEGRRSSSQLLRSPDGGRSWHCIVGIADSVLDLFPGAGTTAFAATGHALFRSDDRGDTWAPVDGLPSEAWILTGWADENGLVVGTSREGVLVSEDSARWRPAHGLEDECSAITALLAAPADTARIYAGTAKGCIYRSRDRGASFERLSSPADPSAARPGERTTLAMAVGEREVLFAGTWRGVFWSDDDGGSWTPVAAGQLGSAYAINDLRVISDPKPFLYAASSLALLRVPVDELRR